MTMKTKFPLLFTVLACAFLVLRELLWAQPAPFNYPPAAGASGLQAMNQNQFDSTSTNIKSGAMITNASLVGATNTGTYYSTGSGVAAPFYTFSGADTTGLGNSSGYALLWTEGTIALALKHSLREVRVPSDYKLGFSSSADNLNNVDTTLDRVSAGVIGTTNMAVTNFFGQTVQILQRTETNNPSTVTDSGFLFAKDVAGTAEVFVMDEGGTATQISPHSRTSPGRAVDAGNGLPVVIHHRNDFVGIEEWIHLSALARKVEQLTGEKFVFARPVPKKDWAADQAEKQAAYDAARFTERQALLAWQAKPLRERTNSAAPVVRPARDIRKPNPWN